MTPVFAPTGVAALRPWMDAGVLGATEVHAAAIVAEIIGDEAGAGEVILAAALALWAPQHGHTCIDADTIADVIADELARAAAETGDAEDTVVATLPWPEPTAWLAALGASSAVHVVDTVDTHGTVDAFDTVNAGDASAQLDDRPLVLFGRRVYTQRQWVDERSVAAALRRRGPRRVPATAAAAVLDGVLPSAVDGVVNDQHAAALTATRSLLTVIAGGPGTGKTHTVAALLRAELAGDPSVRIGLAAPTAKAASRLREAIVATAAGRLDDGGLDPEVARLLSDLPAQTVHRLLGPRPEHRTRFVHDAHNPLDYDLIVVDEASMLSLPLSARLLEAVPDHCRLVLVGDPDQLSSIDVGAVLGDVVAAAGVPGSALADCLVRLTRQRRTGEASPIGPLAEAIRRGDADDVVDLLRAGTDDRLRFVETTDGEVPDAAVAAVLDAVTPAYSAAREAALVDERAAALVAAGAARVLCGHRRGPFGVARWNQVVEAQVAHLGGDAAGDIHPVAGRVLMATRNDPRTGLANGDQGVLVRVGPAIRAVFLRGGELAAFDLAELDAVETAFALTVHKSQGSEYATVALVHPPAESPLVSRELLYTAVTRTASRLVVVGSVASIRRAVTTPTRRVTGLADALA